VWGLFQESQKTAFLHLPAGWIRNFDQQSSSKGSLLKSIGLSACVVYRWKKPWGAEFAKEHVVLRIC